MGLLELFWMGVGTMSFCATGLLLYRCRFMTRLPALNENKQPVAAELVSVILPARDEESRLKQTLEHLLVQTVPIEVVIVNDRSTDRTREIAEEFARSGGGIRATHVSELPPGWLGKCHACYLGAKEARGEWILFTDADCWLSKDVIERALTAAKEERVDHITLTPGIVGTTKPAQAWHVTFLLTLAELFLGLKLDLPGAHLGMGAFNLIRKELYDRCGGHEALRLTVLDDVRLGLLVRRAGGSSRAFIGGEDAQCHWGTTARSMIKIMEKNFFAATNYKTALVVGVAFFGLLVWPTAWAGLVMGNRFGIFAAAGMASFSIPAAVLARRLGWGLTPALLAPFMLPLQAWAITRSAWITLRQGGIRWRETFYSLEELRKGDVMAPGVLGKTGALQNKSTR